MNIILLLTTAVFATRGNCIGYATHVSHDATQPEGRDAAGRQARAWASDQL